MADPLTPEEEAAVRKWVADRWTEDPPPVDAVFPRLLATLDAERAKTCGAQPAPALDAERLARVLRSAKPCGDPSCPSQHTSPCDNEVAAIAREYAAEPQP